MQQVDLDIGESVDAQDLKLCEKKQYYQSRGQVTLGQFVSTHRQNELKKLAGSISAERNWPFALAKSIFVALCMAKGKYELFDRAVELLDKQVYFKELLFQSAGLSVEDGREAYSVINCMISKTSNDAFFPFIYEYISVLDILTVPLATLLQLNQQSKLSDLQPELLQQLFPGCQIKLSDTVLTCLQQGNKIMQVIQQTDNYLITGEQPLSIQDPILLQNTPLSQQSEIVQSDRQLSLAQDNQVQQEYIKNQNKPTHIEKFKEVQCENQQIRSNANAVQNSTHIKNQAHQNLNKFNSESQSRRVNIYNETQRNNQNFIKNKGADKYKQLKTTQCLTTKLTQGLAKNRLIALEHQKNTYCSYIQKRQQNSYYHIHQSRERYYKGKQINTVRQAQYVRQVIAKTQNSYKPQQNIIAKQYIAQFRLSPGQLQQIRKRINRQYQPVVYNKRRHQNCNNTLLQSYERVKQATRIPFCRHRINRVQICHRAEVRPSATCVLHRQTYLQHCFPSNFYYSRPQLCYANQTRLFK